MPEPACLDYRALPSDPSFDHGTKRSVSDAVGAENQSVSVIRFEPGEAGPRSFHDAPVEELYFVLEGWFEFDLDGETFDASPGTAAFIPPGTVHRPRNVSGEPAVLLVVQSPPASGTTYLEE